MSSVDNRIVEMQFNNKRFEENARETMSTLDKLKEKLKFKDSTKELQDFQDAADDFNLSRIANSLEDIGDRFTLMGQVGVQAMERIANAAINAGVALVKSISIDQIRAGMSKYEEETNVIQTLYGALKPKGTKLDEIYDVMETLTAYSDETSYNYTQMADAVSKFVNAGVDLKKAETVIEGISNAAALAGIGIHDTAIIYRNFADAIGKGGFSLMDWKSIKIAHMDTEWLKEAFINEAIAQGKLDKSGRVQTKAEKKNKKGQVTQAAEYKDVRKNFEDTLSKGWLDNDVIAGVMLKYATRDLEGFGKEAFAAAQNAKTFTDVLDAVKDSVSTGWSRTFRIIFGNLEEAIAFFTPMANKVIEFTAAIDEARNTVFEQWRDLGGRGSMIEFLKTLWDSFNSISEAMSKGLMGAFLESFYPSAKELRESKIATGGYLEYVGEQVYNLTKGIEDAAKAFDLWLTGDTIGEGKRRIVEIEFIFRGLFSAVNIVRQAIGGLFTFFKSIFDQLAPTFDSILIFFGEIGLDINNLNRDLAKDGGFTSLAKNLAAIFVPLTSRLPKVINWIRDLYKRVKLFWRTNKQFVQIRKSIERLFDSFIKFLPTAIESVINFGKSFIEMVKNSDEWKFLLSNYNKYIRPWLDRLINLGKVFADTMSGFFEIDTSGESTMWGKLKKRFSVFGNLGPYLQSMWDNLKNDLPWLQNIEEWWNTSPVIQEIKAWVLEIARAIDVFMSEDTSGNNSIIGKIKQRFEAMWGELGPWIEKKWKEYKEKFPFLQQMEDFLSPIFGWGKKAIEATTGGEEGTNKITGFLENLWGKIQEFVSKVDFGKLAIFGSIIFGFVEIYKAVKALTSWAGIGENISDAIEKVGGFFGQLQTTLKNRNMLSKVKAVLEVAASIWLLADAFVKVSALNWDQVGVGLATMAGLFVEDGLFMILMTKFNEGPGKIGAAAMLGTALSMWLLGRALLDVSTLDWDEVKIGLATMGGLFLEQGAFTILVNRFGATSTFVKKGIGFLSSIGIAASMMLLGKALLDVSTLNWDQVKIGLATMGGLFLEQGAFVVLVNQFGSSSKLVNKGTGFWSMIGVAASMVLLGKELKDLASLSWDEIKHGLGVMGGLFLEEGAFIVLVNQFGSSNKLVNKGAGFWSMMGVATSMYLLGQTLVDVSSLNWDQVKIGLATMGGLFLEEGAFIVLVNQLGSVNSVSKGTSFLSLIGVAGSMYLLGQTLVDVSSLSWDEIKNGLKAMAALFAEEGAFVVIMGFLNNINLGTAIKGAAALVIVATGLAAAIAIILEIVGQAAQDFSANIATVGANLVAYSEQVEQVNFEAVNSSVDMLKDLATAFVEIGAKDYGNLDTFRSSLTRLGSSIKLFASNSGNLDLEKMKAATAALKQMANDLSDLKSVSDVSTTIGNIAGAIKLYSESMDGVTFSSDPPDAMAMQIVFNALKDIIPTDDEMAEVASYASESKGNEMTNFAIGLTNIATAVSEFSKNAKDLNFENIQKAIDSLTSISSLDTSLQTTTITHIGPFAKEVSRQREPLSTFAEDIVTLGTALNDFGNSIAQVNTDNLTTGTTVLGKIVELNKALPPQGGISSWILGTQSLTNFAAQLRLLGGGAAAFSESIAGTSFDANAVRGAGEALIKIAEVNAKLPKTGGISSWFTGDESLANFSTGLKELGTGVKEFVIGLGETEVTEKVIDAVDVIRRIASIQVALGNTASWYTMDTLGSELSKAADQFIEVNNKIAGVTSWADTSSFERLLNFAVEQQAKLGGTTYTKSLKDIGTSVKEFFTEVWSFTSTWNGGDSGKLDKVTQSVVGVFTALNNIFTKAETKDSFSAVGGNLLQSMMDGFSSDNSKTIAQNAVKTICSEIVAKVKSYTGTGKAFYNVGTWIPAGLGDGIYANRYAAINAAVDVMNAAIAAAEDAAGISSPSKEFARLGMYSDMGLAQGLQDYVHIVDSAAGKVSQSALGAVLNDLQALQDLPIDQLEINPTIRPVLDTSDISNRAGMISDLLNGSRTIGFNTRQLDAQAQLLGDSGSRDVNSITQQINGLRDQLAHLEETISNIKMVVNTGALVGAMSVDIDKAMGSMSRRAERGN